MSLQKTVNVDQGFGVQGSFYDNSPRRVAPFVVTAGTPIVEVKATGTITLTDVPTTADTFVVGTQTYTLKDTLAAAFDIQIGATAAATAASIAKAINADGVAGTDYFAGTTANLAASGALTDTAEVTLTAIYGGLVGNIVILTEDADNTTVSGSGYLTGGVDAFANSATVGHAFAYDPSNEKQVICAGSGVFAGILVNPKSYTHSGLGDTLIVENGTLGELATMGHLVLKPSNTIAIGHYGFFNDSTGAIAGFVDDGAHAGYTLISDSSFIFVNATSPTGLAVLSITGA